jgi:hypothetical protein
LTNIRAISALCAEAKVVKMRCGAVFEDRNQLMLGAVEAALTGIGFVPHQKVFPFRVERQRGVEQFLQMPPIHENVMN